jgi:hypothetical protein
VPAAIPARVTRNKKILCLVNIPNVYGTVTAFTTQVSRGEQLSNRV